MKKTLSIDIETYSPADLTKCGVYKYAEAADFEILLFAYSYDYGAVHIVDLAQGEVIPGNVLSDLTDPAVLKTAYNAQFERVCLNRFLRMDMDASQWECTMVKAAMLGLPFGLKLVGEVLNLDVQKSAVGNALIKYFSIPCSPTARNGQRTRNLPQHDLFRWMEFKEYCIRDVEAENAIRQRIDFFRIPDREKQLYDLDQRINDRGIRIDRQLAENAIRINESVSEALMKDATALTGLSNPNSDAQIKSWIEARTSYYPQSLNKADMPAVRSSIQDEKVIQVLELREQLSKSSVKKYEAMLQYITHDDRAHGLLQFYGANRTGRWAGRGIQMQNLPRIYERHIGRARDIALQGESTLLELLYGNVPDILSQLVRTAFVATPGHRLIVADFSAIEARVLAWLAGEQWRLDVFSGHGKIYEASAAAMFHVPIESIGKESPLRQKGKVAELACGYGGGPGALMAMGALNMGLTEDELPGIIRGWRNANRKVVKFWQDAEEAAIEAVNNPGTAVTLSGQFTLLKTGNILYITLPSGRQLCYYEAQLKPDCKGKVSVSYYDLNGITKKWQRTSTYGGKLTENIVQAVSRDLLAEAMLNLDTEGYKIVGHVHDEVILDMPVGSGSLEEVIAIMTRPPKWAKGLPLAADGFENEYYKK